MLKRTPFHPLLLAVYPALALLAYNLSEVEPSAARRSLLISLALGAGLFRLLRLVLGDWRKAGLATSAALLLFFAYGHAYGLLEGATLLGVALGRHRFMAPVFLAALAACVWWSGRRLKDPATATAILNLAAVVLVVFPLLSIGRASLAAAQARGAVDQPASEGEALPNLHLETPRSRPDIYYIILDSYTRADALQQDLGFDNQPFLEALRQRGFYVADCSRSNYSNTLSSLTTTLNMEFLPSLLEQVAEAEVWVLLKHSLVRRQLEALGYQTVAFETGYEWSRLDDADIYLGRAQQSYAMQRITPFEAMLAKSTLLLPLIESNQQTLAARFKDVNFPYSDHINRQLFILDQLPQIASNLQPTFTFVHLLIPHVPYIFGPEGQLLTDPGFYSGRKGSPVSDDYLRRGYTGEVQFINRRILEVVDQILDQSRRLNPQAPPVILIQGDHGLRKNNRFLILNAYFVSEQAQTSLYPAISPVNSFRVVFNAYFNAGLPLLPDASYSSDQPQQLVEETMPTCR